MIGAIIDAVFAYIQQHSIPIIKVIGKCANVPCDKAKSDDDIIAAIIGGILLDICPNKHHLNNTSSNMGATIQLRRASSKISTELAVAEYASKEASPIDTIIEEKHCPKTLQTNAKANIPIKDRNETRLPKVDKGTTFV